MEKGSETMVNHRSTSMEASILCTRSAIIHKIVVPPAKSLIPYPAKNEYSQHLLQTFFVHGHLDRDMREVVVHFLIRPRLDGGVVLGVLVVLCDRTNAVGDTLDDL